MPALKWRYLAFREPRFPLGKKRFPSITATDSQPPGKARAQAPKTQAVKGVSGLLLLTRMKTTSLTAPKITVFSSQAGHRWLRCTSAPAWEAAWACLRPPLVSLLRQPAGPPMAGLLPAPSQNWGGKHNPCQTQTLTSLQCQQSGVLNPLPAAPCQSGNVFLRNTISNAGGQGHHCWTQNKTYFFLTFKNMTVQKKRSIKAFDSLPIKHNNSIFLSKQKN